MVRDQGRHRRSALAWIAMSLMPATAASSSGHEVVRVLMQERAGQWHAEAHLETGASGADAWETLTDFDHLSRFVPHVVASRRIANGSGILVAQRVQTRFLLCRITLPVVFRVTEDRKAGLLRARAVGGSFRQFEEEWRVSTASGTTHIDSSAVVVPAVPLPQWTLHWRIRNDAVESLTGLLAEIQRRSQAHRRHPSDSSAVKRLTSMSSSPPVLVSMSSCRKNTDPRN